MKIPYAWRAINIGSIIFFREILKKGDSTDFEHILFNLKVQLTYVGKSDLIFSRLESNRIIYK